EHFLIPEKALKDLSLMLDGNGVKAAQVRMLRHETIVHQIPGTLVVTLKPDISTKQLKGKQSVGEVHGSKPQVMSDALALGGTLVANETVQQEVLESTAAKPGQSFGTEPYKF